MVDRLPGRMARTVPRTNAKACCGGGGDTPALGPKRMDVVQMEDGETARMEQEKNPDLWHVAEPNPPDTINAEWLNVFVDWLAIKLINAVSHTRTFWYAARSAWSTVRWGWVSHHTYHLRAMHCDHRENGKPCRWRITRTSGFHYCGFEAEGCGCFASLRVMLRYRRFECKDKAFGRGRDVQPLLIQIGVDHGDSVDGN